ncbi:UDP-N-acetylenolpyruvoylglucosamine reductase [Desulfoluna limicola]|uniref:UDP-N-acetylenolpyruvoylglucosamine reductase n=1 Tax=Desulfoluna limicola TaxID=2810562 RepID=A0ABN6EZH5_9BACT|nr:UDP-N-acetylmuramate dehydrogenase [Desulfoluna limicola]BCS94460.1 UDP-N-acetylenolpyruvoylglucosamine reductase [Desulfoluna limicola]
MAALSPIDALSALYQGVLKKEEPMARHTTFKVGGPCDLYLEPGSLDDLRIAVAFLTQQGLPLTVVGDGTNLLVRDGGIEGAVISLAGIDIAIKEEKTDGEIFLTVPAGVKTQHLCRFAAVRGYQGLNFATGIPGTVGGALAMNAGTDRGAFGDIVESLTLLDAPGKLRTVEAVALDFAYRHLAIEGVTRHDADFPIIVSARLRLGLGDRDALVSEREELLARRKASQPVNLPSAGCFFKNPPQGPPAGQLIDGLGFKGAIQGGAKVSELHANYLVNIGSATAGDILTLAGRIKERVKQTHGIQLEEEVTLVGREA